MSPRPRLRIGDPAEAEWAGTAYARQLKAVNARLAANEQPNHFSFLPCGVNVPVTAGRCSSPNDANWAGSNLCGQGPLYGSAYRDLPITSCAWRIASTTGARTPGGKPAGPQSRFLHLKEDVDVHVPSAPAV